MNAGEALGRLRRLGVPVIGTADAAAALGESGFAASKTLGRLAKAGLVERIRQGTWLIDDSILTYAIAEHLTAPMPAYVSLHTALHLHGMIEQIPSVVYVVSLARTQRVKTRRGTFSIHHVAPEVFGGFTEERGFKLASPEKSLFDVAYLAGTRTRLFTRLPELALPRRFRRAELEKWLARIPSAKRRSQVANALARLGA